MYQFNLTYKITLTIGAYRALLLRGSDVLKTTPIKRHPGFRIGAEK